MRFPLRIPMAARYFCRDVDRARLVQRLRMDEQACREALNCGHFSIFHRLAPLLMPTQSGHHAPLLSAADMINLLSDLDHEEDFLEESVLLGCSNDFTQLFAIDLGNSDKAVLEKTLGGVFVKMRQSFFMLGGNDVALLSKGHALLKWHFNNRYSGTSGHLTKKDVSGSKRTCLTTGTIFYPQMSPAVITQVSNGTHCLLARKAIFPPGLYTTLAGFCEIGETVEAAVHREVAEEVGLKVVSVQYSGSQHWPFPSCSLMIGCQARVHPSNSELSLDETELEAACWFGKEEVRAALQAAVSAENIGGGNDRFSVPPPWTIAHQLIREWLHEE